MSRLEGSQQSPCQEHVYKKLQWKIPKTGLSFALYTSVMFSIFIYHFIHQKHRTGVKGFNPFTHLHPECTHVPTETKNITHQTVNYLKKHSQGDLLKATKTSAPDVNGVIC